MIRKVVITVFLLFGTLTSAVAFDNVKFVSFKGTSTAKNKDLLMLKGKLTKPQRDGPFPAVVMLHGCAGPSIGLDPWAERLTSWGYVTLQVDSFGPRGVLTVCDNPVIPSFAIAQDAHDAKSYLAGLPFVDRKLIGVMGWSYGGWLAIYAIGEMPGQKTSGDPFKVAVAFYPSCRRFFGLNAPLLILSGELDTIMPAERCRSRMLSLKTSHEVILKIYPKAYHSFDMELLKGFEGALHGHRL